MVRVQEEELNLEGSAAMLILFLFAMNHTTYVLYSSKLDRYYIGYSSSFVDRFQYHNDPTRNRIWTKRGMPWEIYFTIDGLDKTKARKLEIHLKKMKSREYIEKLKDNPESIEELKALLA